MNRKKRDKMEHDLSKMIDKHPNNKKRKKRLKKILTIVLPSVVFVICAIVVGFYLYFKNIMKDPGAQFNIPAVKPGNTASQGDFNGIVNILLVGLDYSEQRSGWAESDTYNTDVMIVLAVDFNNKKVDMISLPRDSYVQMPNAAGIYKLNAAMKCGGGYPKGFDEVLSAAKWMLGGIPVDYYYGVTMPVIEDLVNVIGGIDYDLDFDFTVDNRSYSSGFRHMNGLAVLDYMRVRKNIEESGDLNRINRQKQMLMVIFKKMQQQNLWTKLPSILGSLKNQVVTNTTISQTAALASLAYSLKEENIKMHSMGGTMASVFNYNFCITDQAARVSLLKEVYGATLPAYSDYDYDGTMKKWAGMMYGVYQPNALTLINYVQGLVDTGRLPSAPPKTPTPKPGPTNDPLHTLSPIKTPTPKPSTTPKNSPTTSGISSGSRAAMAASSNGVYNKYLEVKTLYSKVLSLSGQGTSLIDALKDLKDACTTLASWVNHPLKLDDKWDITYVNQYDVY